MNSRRILRLVGEKPAGMSFRLKEFLHLFAKNLVPAACFSKKSLPGPCIHDFQRLSEDGHHSVLRVVHRASLLRLVLFFLA